VRVIRVSCEDGTHTITITDEYIRLDDHSSQDVADRVTLNMLAERTVAVPQCVRKLAYNQSISGRLPMLLADGIEGSGNFYSLILDALGDPRDSETWVSEFVVS
jgi:hypothetical protein